MLGRADASIDGITNGSHEISKNASFWKHRKFLHFGKFSMIPSTLNGGEGDENFAFLEGKSMISPSYSKNSDST